MVQWFKANGFQPRAMAMTDIMTGLSTGMIDGMPSTPLAAMLFQWNRQAPYMLDIGLAPIVGASVMSQKAWNAIPAADKPKLLEAAAGVEKRLRADVPKLDENAVAIMTKNGLTVTKASGPEWKTQLDSLAKALLASETLDAVDAYAAAGATFNGLGPRGRASERAAVQTDAGLIA